MSAAELIERLRREGVAASPWSNGADARYTEHSHGYDKVLVAATGAITFHLPSDGGDFELRPGDRLDLPAETRHAATVGGAGVTCLEAHLPAGALDGMPRQRAAGEW